MITEAKIDQARKTLEAAHRKGELKYGPYCRCLTALNEVTDRHLLREAGCQTLTEEEATHIVDSLIAEQTPTLPEAMVRYYQKRRYDGF